MNITQQLVKQARTFAATMHMGQRYGDDPYMVHLDAVADKFNAERDPLCKIVAYLHDVLEDTECCLGDLTFYFGTEVAKAVSLVTRDPQSSKTYFEFVRSICESGNETAIRVKMADNECNLSATGKPELNGRYIKSFSMLETKLKQMNNTKGE